MKRIPNLFTLLNLFFGCLAIVFTLQNGITIVTDADGSQLVDMPEQIWMASLFIGLAGLVDFLDGFVARLFKATSPLGAQLDSLADVVSFGAAPGMILYQFLRLTFAKEDNGLDVSLLWLVPAFILPCAAAWRLAKFNLDAEQQYNFKGVPTPAVGLLIASLPLVYWNIDAAWVHSLLLNKWFLYALIVLLSYLLVSSLPMMGLKFKEAGLRNNWSKYFLAALALAAIFTVKWLAFPVIFVAYVLISLLFKNKTA